MKAPTRILVIEDIDSWTYTLARAARRAGASEVVSCSNLDEVRESLRLARFDAAIVDIGLDVADDLDAEGVHAIEMIRGADGLSTRCVMVTGWQGDRLDLMADLQRRLGVEWAFMKEKYESHALIAKLTELLEQPSGQVPPESSMANLSGGGDSVYIFESKLLGHLDPKGGVNTLYTLTANLVGESLPLIAQAPDAPMHRLSDRSVVGIYWSRRLATAVCVDLSKATGEGHTDELRPALEDFLGSDSNPELVKTARVRNVLGRLWELSDIERERFPG